jgi:ABC-type lipoprotein export system ATPase subunit
MIQMDGIQKTYRVGDVEVAALRDISLHIEPGEFVAIMGPSGCGKSTLMHLMGLLDSPDGGSYQLGAQEVAGLDDDALSAIRNSKIGFVFQSFNLLPRASALENVALPLIYTADGADAARAANQLQLVGLQDRVHHRPSQLSGGQQQRVAIARALINDPAILLADEPTGNLDTKSSEEIMALFGELHRDGRTVIVVTHAPEVARYAQRVIQLKDGRIIDDSPANIPAAVARTGGAS